MAATIDCEQSPELHPEGTVYNRSARILDGLPADAPVTLIWGISLQDMGMPVSASRGAVRGQTHFSGHGEMGTEIATRLLERVQGLTTANWDHEPVRLSGVENPTGETR
jgi:poly(A) polymerase